MVEIWPMPDTLVLEQARVARVDPFSHRVGRGYGQNTQSPNGGFTTGSPCP